jgi:dephospho-CoA kinase
MRTVFLAGGIGSGKSTVARELERLGCCRIDLDQLSREVLLPGTQTTLEVARAFGMDLLDEETGALDRRLLAERAFATSEDAARLEQIELPAIARLLEERLSALSAAADPPEICLVEIPLLDRADAMRHMASETVVVDCPVELRRVRAIGRGMTGEDFDARVANQPTDEWLRAHADTIICNTGTYDELIAQVHDWYESHKGGE